MQCLHDVARSGAIVATSYEETYAAHSHNRGRGVCVAGLDPLSAVQLFMITS